MGDAEEPGVQGNGRLRQDSGGANDAPLKDRATPRATASTAGLDGGCRAGGMDQHSRARHRESRVYEAVQLQLEENRQRARQGQRGARYLLQGLICCARCGYAYYGKALSPSTTKGRPRSYAYYRCIGTDAYRFGGERLCENRQVRTDRLDAAVWQEVRQVLEEPERLIREYQRRITEVSGNPRGDDLASLAAQIRKLRQGIGRLIDSYAEGLIERGDFEPRVSRLRERVASLEARVQEVEVEASLQREMQLIIGQVEDFARTIVANLDQIDWTQQREIIRSR